MILNEKIVRSIFLISTVFLYVFNSIFYKIYIYNSYVSIYIILLSFFINKIYGSRFVLPVYNKLHIKIFFGLLIATAMAISGNFIIIGSCILISYLNKIFDFGFSVVSNVFVGYSIYKNNIDSIFKTILFYWLWSAVSEEFIFRGYILKEIFIVTKNIKNNKYIALFISSLLFGAAHYIYAGVEGVFIPVIFGVVLGVFYIKDGFCLVIPIIAHAAYDTILLFFHVDINVISNQLSG